MKRRLQAEELPPDAVLAVGRAGGGSTAQGRGDYGINGDLRRARETQAAIQIAAACAERDAALEREAAFRAQLAAKAALAPASGRRRRRYGPREAGRQMEALFVRLEAVGAFKDCITIISPFYIMLAHQQQTGGSTAGWTKRIYRSMIERRRGATF